MKLFIKRVSLGVIAVLVLASSIIVALPSPEKALAANEDKLCIPKYSKVSGAGDDNWQTEAFEFEFLSRFEIKVTYKNTGDCSSPKGQNSDLLHADGTAFAPFVNQTLTLRILQTGSGGTSFSKTTFVIYGVGKNGSSAESDESLIKTANWNSGFSTKPQTKDWELYVNKLESTFNKIFENAQYTIGIEEDLLKGSATCGGTNSNFHLINENNDGLDVKWRCDNDSTNETGATILGHIKNWENFNIAFKASPDGKTISSINPFNNDTKFDFKWCNIGSGKFVNDNCNGNKQIDGLTPDDVIALGANTKLVKITEDGVGSFDTVIAGSSNPASGTPGSGSNTTTPADIGIGCDVSILNPLTWLFCPIITAASEVTDKLDNAIVKKLNIDTDDYFDTSTDTGNSFKDAWASFRTLGLVFLVIAALVMVISQSFSVGPFDAYTVKKVVPRILIAVIFMALSWDLCVLLINITNDASLALRQIVQSPFSNLQSPIISGQTSFVGGLAVGAAGLGLGIIGLASFVLTAWMAVMIAFLVLTIREMAIIFLVIMAPFAIAAYILPGTEKLWKMWWDTFSKALLMFPIIMLFIGVGRSFAAVVQASPNSESLLSQVVIIIAYFGPYFALPTAFRLAGGAIANIAGVANDRGRGAFDRLKKFREGKASSNWGKMKTGERFGADHKRLNAFSQRLTRPDAVLPGRYGLKGKSALSTNVSSQTNQYAKQLQELGLLDDVAGNEFIKHGHSIGALSSRVAALRSEGKESEANSLAAYAQFAGNRGAILGAAKLNAGFGKLSDGALESLSDRFGKGDAEQAALGAAFGDLIFTSKNAGNYGTYAAKLENGRVKSYSSQLEDDPTVARNYLASKLKDGGPNVIGNLKPYKDETSGIDIKEETIKALALAARDGNSGALDQLAAVGAAGSYTDPTTRKAALDAAETLGISSILNDRIRETRVSDPRADGREEGSPPPPPGT